MKNLKLSIKQHHLTDSYNPTFRKYDHVSQFDFENDDDVDKIYEIVNLYVHSYYEYVDDVRNEMSFKSASAILLDFDNKGIHNDSTIDEFMESSFAKKYNWFLYTSKSHIPKIQECFHVVLPLDTPITDLSTLRSTYTSVFEEIDSSGLMCDNQVRDGARLIYPSMNISNDTNSHFDNFMFDIYRDGVYLQKTISSEEYEPIISKNTIEHEYYDDDDDFDDDDLIGVYKNMSKKSRYIYIKSIVTFINNHNKYMKYKYLNYNKWIAIGYSLYRLFGEVKGKKLFRLLSRGYPGDTLEIIDNQFSYLKNCVYSSKDNLHILLKISALIGFNHDMYMKYYFMSKHNFTITQSSILYKTMIRKLLENNCIPLEYIDNVKIYDYSFKKHTRSFLMEIKIDGDITHMTVRLGEMMDIFAQMLDIPRQFVTTSITKGVIRRFINKNGVYDITRFIKTKILDVVSNTDSVYVRVKHINDIMKNIRSYAPSTIQSLITNKNIELYMFELGIFVDKRKKRFTIDGCSKPYTAYKIDKSKIVLETKISIPKSDYIEYRVHGSNNMNYNYNHKIKNNIVMKC